MPIVKSVERIEITIATGTVTNTGTLTKGQIDNKSVPFTTIATTRNTEERFDTRFVTVTISGTTVTATRDQSSNNTTVEIIIYVVEFTDECTVTTGEATIGSGQLTITDTVALTDLARSFLYVTFMPTNATDDFDDSLSTAEITNTTTLTFTRQATGGEIICQWYTVECDATQFDVQTGVITLAGTNNTAESAAFTAVDTTRTMVIGNYNTNENSDDAETGNCTIDLVDTTHVRARRANGTTPTAGAIEIDFQVIQFESAESISVQRGEFLMSGVEDTDTITAVDVDVTMAHSPSGQNNASINSVNGDDIGQLFCRMDVQDSTTVRGRVITDSTETVNSWEVVEWIGVVPPVGGIIKSVEKILITIPTSATSNTGTLTKGQIDNKCVPFTTVAAAAETSEVQDTRFVRVTISGNTVTATRNAASSIISVDVIIFVVEYTDECTVQTGEITVPALTSTDSPPIDFTDLTKTFVYMTFTPNTTSDDLDDTTITVEITNTTTLTFTRQNVSGDITCRWYTVECDATQFDVQRGSFLLDGTNNTAQSAAFTAVDTTRTMVIGNFNTDENLEVGETGQCTIDLVDSTHVRARRADGTTPAAGEIDVDFQVIQYAAAQDISVQRGEFSITVTEDTDTITAVDLNRSMAHSPGGENNASIDSVTASSISQFFAKMDLQDSTTVRGRVITDSTNAVFSWEVLEYRVTAEEVRVFSTAITNISAMI